MPDLGFDHRIVAVIVFSDLTLLAAPPSQVNS